MDQKSDNIRYVLHEESIIEDFDDGALLFLCRQRRFVDINHVAKRIIDLMNGSHNLWEINKMIADYYGVKEEITIEDTRKLVEEMISRGAIIPYERITQIRSEQVNKLSNLFANPDVWLRIEKDGALLFNANSDALLVINQIGLLIWKFIKSRPRSRAEIVSHLLEMCEDVPNEIVESDVEAFIANLLEKEFVREVLDEKKI